MIGVAAHDLCQASEQRTLAAWALYRQITSNLERAWEITGSGEDELPLMMLKISQGVAREFKAEE